MLYRRMVGIRPRARAGSESVLSRTKNIAEAALHPILGHLSGHPARRLHRGRCAEVDRARERASREARSCSISAQPLRRWRCLEAAGRRPAPEIVDRLASCSRRAGCWRRPRAGARLLLVGIERSGESAPQDGLDFAPAPSGDLRQHGRPHVRGTAGGLDPGGQTARADCSATARSRCRRPHSRRGDWSVRARRRAVPRRVVRPQILFPAYLRGFNLAEAYTAMPYLSWQTIVIGDPLCTPVPRRTLLTEEITKASTRKLAPGALFGATAGATFDSRAQHRGAEAGDQVRRGDGAGQSEERGGAADAGDRARTASPCLPASAGQHL